MKLDYPFTEAEAEAAYNEWGCNCGPTALAFALQTKLEFVRGIIPDFESRRYTSPMMMASALKAAGVTWSSVRFEMRAYPATQPLMFHKLPALVRIQWCGPWTDPGANPKWAYRQTHWVCMFLTEIGREIVFDCNGGMRVFESWEEEIVPKIVETIPRADGGWFPTHIWRLTSRPRFEESIRETDCRDYPV